MAFAYHWRHYWTDYVAIYYGRRQNWRVSKEANGKIRGYCELCGREVGLDEPGNKCPLCGAELYYEPKVYDMYKYGKKIDDICEKEDK